MIFHNIKSWDQTSGGQTILTKLLLPLPLQIFRLSAVLGMWVIPGIMLDYFSLCQLVMPQSPASLAYSLSQRHFWISLQKGISTEGYMASQERLKNYISRKYYILWFFLSRWLDDMLRIILHLFHIHVLWKSVNVFDLNLFSTK